jgi:hypothetical protein
MDITAGMTKTPDVDMDEFSIWLGWTYPLFLTIVYGSRNDNLSQIAKINCKLGAVTGRHMITTHNIFIPPMEYRQSVTIK